MIKRNCHTWVKYVLILGVFLTSSNILKAQFNLNEDDTYGAGFYKNVNGMIRNRHIFSGHYIHGRKSFELGVILNQFESVSGMVFRHQYYLNKTDQGKDYHPDDFSIRTYMVYNFVYNGNVSESYLRHSMGEETIRFDKDLTKVPTVNTIEHYLGVGTEVDLTSHIYLNLYAGGGLYFYRNNSRMVHEGDQLLPEQMTGLTWNMSMGIGYHF